MLGVAGDHWSVGSLGELGTGAGEGHTRDVPGGAKGHRYDKSRPDGEREQGADRHKWGG